MPLLMEIKWLVLKGMFEKVKNQLVLSVNGVVEHLE
jgi:hypothetical protein